MIDRKKMINALRDIADYFCACRKNAVTNGAAARRFEIYVEAAEDAVELLKAQEPRVMTLDELRQLEHTDHIVWIEANGDPESFDGYAEVTTNFVTKDIELFVPGNEVEFIPDNKNYGKTWRCWSSKPTDKQREAVPWQE